MIRRRFGAGRLYRPTNRTLLNRPKNLERAAELDPQNPHVLNKSLPAYNFLIVTLIKCAPWIAQLRYSKRSSACALRVAEVELDWHADTRPLLSTIEAILAEIRAKLNNAAAGGSKAADFQVALQRSMILLHFPHCGCLLTSRESSARIASLVESSGRVSACQ